MKKYKLKSVMTKNGHEEEVGITLEATATVGKIPVLQIDMKNNDYDQIINLMEYLNEKFGPHRFLIIDKRVEFVMLEEVEE